MYTQKEIQDWLTANIAQILTISPDQVDIRAPFSSYGLSSRDAILLSGDLEDWLDRRLSPTLVYEYPTIEALAVYLVEDGREEFISPEPVSSRSQRSDDLTRDGLGSTPEGIEQLSDKEFEALLLKKLDDLEQGEV